MDQIRELRKRAQTHVQAAKAILDNAEEEDRGLNDEEQEEYDDLVQEAEKLQSRAQRLEEHRDREQKAKEKVENRKAEGAEQEPSEDEKLPEKRKEEKEEVKVRRDEKESRQHMAYHTLQFMRGSAHNNERLTKRATRALIEGGHYGEEAVHFLQNGSDPLDAVVAAEKQRRQKIVQSLQAEYGEEYRAAGDYYSTLVNADGAYLLPTVVVREIEEIAEQVGVMLGISNSFTHIVGTIRVPGGSGADSAMSFVAEGAAITSRIRAFQAVELNPKKVADIIPWTYEINVEAADQILSDIQRVMGRAYGKAVDDAAINGDGTSTYNSIDGVLSGNRTPGELTLAAGSVDFDDISPDELILGINEVPAGVRSNFVYVFHPDMKAVFKTKKDDNGAYLFSWTEDSEGIMRVGGIPTFYTEVLPALSASAVSTSFGIGGDFNYLKVALGPGLETEMASSGTVTDADTGTDINLFTQDLRALKYRAYFDIDANFDTAFMKFTTPAS